MAITQGLQQRQSQTLAMTTELQQSLKMLQLSSIDLSEMISAELDKNDELPGVPYTTAYGANFPINAAAPHSPKGKTGNNIGFIAYGGLTVPAVGLTYPGNIYMAMDCTRSTAANALACNNGFSGPDAASIDAKIDNGASGTGNITALTLAADVVSIATIRAQAPAGTFTVATLTSNAHILVIRMGSQTGELY